MGSTHHFKLSQTTPTDKTAGGMRFQANKKNLPILSDMSLYKLVLYPRGIREPHWHANADELGYCLQGSVLITMYNTGDAKHTFLVEKGDVFLIPSGALHDIENVGQDNAELVLCFSNEQTEDFNLSSILGSFTDAVLGNTWGMSDEKFQALKRSSHENIFAALGKTTSTIPEQARYDSRYKYSLKKSVPPIQTKWGEARLARQNLWPVATRQALYALTLTGKGMREPHWHPETAELGYVEEGKGRMSIINPSGDVDTYVMEKGDIYFIPKAYPHHIENMEDTPLKLMIFFDQGMPRDIGFTGSVRAYSDEVLGAITNVNAEFWKTLPKYYEDSFIVQKVNPVDE